MKKLASCLSVLLSLFLVSLFPAWSSGSPPPARSAITTKTAPAPAISPANPAGEDQWKAIVEAAKKEGELRIYTSIAPEVRTEVQNAFRDKFGIKIG